MSKNTITSILNQDISWFVDKKSIEELDEASIQHIEDCIRNDISQGELHISYGKNGEKTASGWWHVINWRDIACELYHSLNNYLATDLPSRDAAEKAIKRFDDEWTF